MDANIENDKIKTAYSKRDHSLYSFLKPDIYYSAQEKERVILKVLSSLEYNDFKSLKLLEVGAGSGINLLRFIEYGFHSQNITANELQEERVESLKSNLPNSVKIVQGDILRAGLPSNYFDLILIFVVFSSILNKEYRKVVADKIWGLLASGGSIIWYDFVYNNPKNKDVVGISVKELQELFPHGKFINKKVTLAPPIARIVTKIHPALYSVFNFFPFLRTHIVTFIQK